MPRRDLLIRSKALRDVKKCSCFTVSPHWYRSRSFPSEKGLTYIVVCKKLSKIVRWDSKKTKRASYISRPNRLLLIRQIKSILHLENMPTKVVHLHFVSLKKARKCIYLYFFVGSIKIPIRASKPFSSAESVLIWTYQVKRWHRIRHSEMTFTDTYARLTLLSCMKGKVALDHVWPQTRKFRKEKVLLNIFNVVLDNVGFRSAKFRPERDPFLIPNKKQCCSWSRRP